jgi:hypothetical protein
MKLVLLLCALVALSVPVYGEDPQTAFQSFCEEWMQKLQAREHHNIQNIKWQTNADGVHGGFIGYTREHLCSAKIGTESVPVGTITYREVRYEKRGTSIPQAELSPAQPVETTEITEIFRYNGGRWIY